MECARNRRQVRVAHHDHILCAGLPLDVPRHFAERHFRNGVVTRPGAVVPASSPPNLRDHEILPSRGGAPQHAEGRLETGSYPSHGQAWVTYFEAIEAGRRPRHSFRSEFRLDAVHRLAEGECRPASFLAAW